MASSLHADSLPRSQILFSGKTGITSFKPGISLRLCKRLQNRRIFTAKMCRGGIAASDMTSSSPVLEERLHTPTRPCGASTVRQFMPTFRG